MRGFSSSAALLVALLAVSCGPAEDSSSPGAQEHAAGVLPASDAQLFANVTEARLLAADDEPGQWMATGRTFTEQHWSPLDQITTENVDTLELAWFADFDTNRGQESTPLMIDGVVYVTTAWSKVYAFDARTGEELWKYDPKVPGDWAVHACCDVVNRGAAAWNGKIYVGTIDGRLVALDAETGEEVWSVLTIDRDWPYTITGAPRVVKGKVLIGNGGAESGVRGYVTAYDAETGAEAWRFYTVPGNPADGFEDPILETAAKTWAGKWWTLGGGGTVWDSMAYDPELDLLYIGVGNGSPWNRAIRSENTGENLFLSSIVALDPDDGSYVWHYQTTPGESWDYTATQPIIVADVGFPNPDNEDRVETRRVVMQAPKNGFFYVLDAATGEFISANNHAAVNWATGINPETGRPIENPAARYGLTGHAFALQPSSAGAHNWNPMAFSPETGLVYLASSNNALVYAPDTDFEPTRMGSNLGVDMAAGIAELGPNATAGLPSGSSFVAWDPVRQKAAWRVPATSFSGPGGALATAGGLVFAGMNDALNAYNAETGALLWSRAAQTGVAAAPITYRLDGEQYVAVVAGRSANDYYAPNYSRLLVYKLGGTAQLPPPVRSAPRRPGPPPPATASAETVALGEDVYQRHCIICHADLDSGGGMFRRGLFPDLRRSAALGDAGLFDSVVLEGVLSDNGMVSFASELDADDTDALRAYIIAAANRGAAARPPGPPGAPPRPPPGAPPGPPPPGGAPSAGMPGQPPGVPPGAPPGPPPEQRALPTPEER